MILLNGEHAIDYSLAYFIPSLLRAVLLETGIGTEEDDLAY
jgi:hypothetical protein